MSCRIKNGKYLAPNGEPSILHSNLEKKFGKEVAHNLFVLSNTPNFQQTISTKKENFDSNGEVKPEVIVEYNRRLKESKESLNFEQTQELRNAMLGLQDITDSDQLQYALEQAFYNDGLFNPTESSLRESGIYNEYEIQNILNDISLQGKIKDAVERLKNTNNTPNMSVEGRDIKTTTNVNSFGKLEALNPFQDTEQEVNENLKAIPKKEIVNGELVDKKELLVYPNAVKVADSVEVIDDIEFFQNTPLELQSSEKAQNFLRTIEKRLKNYGIDVNLEDRADLLEPLKQFLLFPNVQNTNILNEVYGGKNEVELREVEKTRPLVYLETNLSEQELFDQFSLIKTADNLYLKVEKVAEEEIAAILEVENMPEIDMYKQYFNIPKTIISEPIDLSDNIQYFNNTNLEEFEADFNVQRLKEAEKYPDFYNNFGVNEKGIFIKNTDNYSLQTIKDYLKSGLIKNSDKLEQYSLISKQMPNLIEQSLPIEMSTKVTERVNAVNNPNSVEAPKGQYIFINENTLVQKSQEAPFVKVNDELFEIVQKQGDLGFYGRIEKNESFSTYNLNPQPPILEVNPLEFTQLESKLDEFSKIKKYYSSQELKKINEENFDCIK